MWYYIRLLSLTSLLTVVAAAQAQAPTTPSEALQQCQSLLRIKQELTCRCDQVEQLAAGLLRRAEKAEQELAQLRTKERQP